jgi:protein-S-isoprenylcysteine O-methyltransferase Ste14
LNSRAVGSYVGLSIFIAVAAAVTWSLLDEEKYQGANLPGYLDYQKKVPLRLIPGVW